MASSSADGTYVQPSIPKFDGHYDHWSMLMENFLRSKEMWLLVEEGVEKLSVMVEPTTAQRVAGFQAEPIAAQKKLHEQQKLNDLKVKNYMFQAIDRGILETILDKSSSMAIWDSMKKYQGSNKVKRAQLQALRKEFEILSMKDGEKVDEYFAITLSIANKMKAHDDQKMDQITVVEKILRSMTPRFNYVVCSIEESNDVTNMSIDELQSSLLVQEQRMKGQQEEEQLLKATNEERIGGSRGRGRWSPRGSVTPTLESPYILIIIRRSSA